VDLKGQVVGINTAIATRSGTFSGIGFAIPSNQAKSVYESLRANGKVVRGYLGVQIADVTNAAAEIKTDLETLGFKGESGVLVRQVMRSGPAFKALQPGDVITEIDGKPVKSMTELRNRIALTKPGQEVKLTVWRDRKTETVSVKLEEQPEDQTLVASAPDAPARSGIGVTLTTPTPAELKAAGLSEDATGALVRQVMPNSPAARVGIRPGDLITRIGDTQIKSADDAKAALKDLDLTKGVRVDLLNREGEKMVTLRRPAR
jgi:serine protease Do